jgi:protein SCO1/2
MFSPIRHITALGISVSILAALLIALLASPAAAETDESPPPGHEGAVVLNRPDAQVPLDVQFSDEEGRTVRLGDFFKADRPVLLMLVYFECPYLCNQTLNGVVEAVRGSSLTPGKDYQLVTISFDPREGPELAKQKKANYLEALGRPSADWHFLTSSRPAAARAVGDAIGFGYKLDEKGERYLHEAAIYVCTPAGRVSRAIRGVRFESDMLRDSLIFASRGKISSGLFGFALFCGMVHFDATTGKYTWAAQAIMQVTGILTVVILGTVIGRLVYKEKRRNRQATAGQQGDGQSCVSTDGGHASVSSSEDG